MDAMDRPQPAPNGLPGMSPPTHTDASPTTKTAVAPQLNDNDKIEKIWVHKVKQVIERTHGDPYQQNQELTALKADYMQQRYNKTIKVDK
jgi:hypothetical protein